MISKNFFETLELVAEDRGLTIEDVLAKLEIAMAVACRDRNNNADIKLDIDHEKKRIRVYEYKHVVEELTEGNKGEILLEDAKLLKPKAKLEIGSEIKEEIDFTKLGRKSVSKFKTTFSSELKALEREEAYNYFLTKENELISATVIDSNASFITFSIGKGMFSSMPVSEAIPGELLNPGDVKKVYVTKVEKTTKGPKVYITRTNRDIVKKLFELNVPEIKDGSIEIVRISREPGTRSKVGVLATRPNLDAKGACVGQGGLRIKPINEELNQEKIDIFTWKNDPVDLISEALMPARCLSVIILDDKNKQACVIVSDDQFSLAIGKNGQNARLACYACEWKIDIKRLSDALRDGIKFTYNVY